jgi:hypothetical protein
LLQAGDSVTVIPYVHCGKCIACRRGATNCCAQLEVLGVHIDDGMQEYISVPKDLIMARDDLDARSLLVRLSRHLLNTIYTSSHSRRNGRDPFIPESGHPVTVNFFLAQSFVSWLSNSTANGDSIDRRTIQEKPVSGS